MVSSAQRAANVPAFLANGGELGARIAAFDWSSTSVGAIADWSQSLRSIVAFLVNSPVPLVMLWGEDGHLIYNDGYSVFAGERHPGLLGMKVLEAWPEVADFNANVMRVGLAGGTLAYRNHKLMLNRTGTLAECWLDLDYSPVFDDDGRPAGVLAVVVETTEAVLADRALRDLNATLERRATERATALEQSQIQFRLLVQGVTDYAIYMLDPDGIVASWNAGAQRIKGYAPDEIMGAHFSTFYLEEDRAGGEPQRALEAARRQGRFAAEGWRLRKGGIRFRASVVIDAIHDDDGKLIGFAKITRDITEREEAQRELEVAREALFQAQKIEAIGQLTGGVAHDFNNLLMAIMSGLTLLRKRLPDGDAQAVRLIDNSMQAAERGAALTQRMLAFARRQELKTERVDIGALVADMRGLLERTIGPAWRIETSFPDRLPRVVADSNQLEMALMNLVVNARDAMPDGGVIRIEGMEQEAIGSVRGLAPGHYVRMTVIDCGTGMDPATLARATEPFFTTKGVGKGTGLGLSMIHGFARQNGGALEMESAPGTGTRAHVWLPVAGACDGISARPPARSLVHPPNRSLVVLVVDDDPLVLMNTADLLADLGHRAIEAESGAVALERLATREDIALLITDQAMPGMTGTELIASARAMRPGLPIVLATGYGETPSDAASGLLRLNKPFTQGDLERAVAEVMQQPA